MNSLRKVIFRSTALVATLLFTQGAVAQDNFAQEDNASAGPTETTEQRFASRENDEGVPTLRGIFALGGQVGVPTTRLASAIGPYSAGGELNLGFAPATWPVLFGVSLNLLTYGVSEFTYDDVGVERSSKIEKLSHAGQLFIRAQPESHAVRPFVDLTGGYWLLAFNHHQRSDDDEGEDDMKTLRASITACWGLRAGVDWLFATGPQLGNYGIGFAASYTRGVGFPLPDFSSAEVRDGEIVVPDTTRLKAPAQFLFTLSFVVASERGNWVSHSPKTVIK